jgi:hypothetical protein
MYYAHSGTPYQCTGHAGTPYQATGYELKMQAPDPRVPAAKPTLLTEGEKTWDISSTHVTLLGLGVLTLIVTLPISDAFILANDPNYAFWAGYAMPDWFIVSLVAVLAIFFVSTQGNPRSVAVNGLYTLTTTFLTTIGIILAFGSMYLYYKDLVITQALTYECQENPLTSGVRHTYEELLTLRQTASCSSMDSVVDCAGYQEVGSLENRNYLRYLEENQGCSGFCYTSGSNATLMQLGNQRRPSSKWQSATSAFLAISDSSATITGITDVLQDGKSARSSRLASLPPSLFSKTTHQISCDGVAARNIHYAGDRIAGTWWYTGIVLISLSAFLGFTECCISGKHVPV